MSQIKPYQHIRHVNRAIRICGSISALAREAGCWPNNIVYAMEAETITGDLAIALVCATKGKITPHDLRPDYWGPDYWPPACRQFEVAA